MCFCGLQMLHQTPLDEPSRTRSQCQNCCGSLGVQTAASWYYNVAAQQSYKAGPMFDSLVKSLCRSN